MTFLTVWLAIHDPAVARESVATIYTHPLLAMLTSVGDKYKAYNPMLKSKRKRRRSVNELDRRTGV